MPLQLQLLLPLQLTSSFRLKTRRLGLCIPKSMVMEDTTVARISMEHQILSSDRGAERNTNRDITNRMSSDVVSNDNTHTHSSRGKFVNVTASLRVIRELIDALLDDKFDFERGEIARKRPEEHKATTCTNIYDYHNQNMSRTSTRHDKPSNSENFHGKEVQQQPVAYEVWHVCTKVYHTEGNCFVFTWRCIFIP